MCAAVLMTLACTGLAQDRSDDTYKLQPEDVLQIQVFGQQQLTAQVPIGRDGYISAPFVGSVQAQGRTIDELTDALTHLYETKMRLRDPIVSVVFVSYRPLHASIGGAVVKPGQYVFRPGDTILTLLNNGGGVVPDVADMRRAYLRHKGTVEIIPLDLYAMMTLGDMSQNYTLQDGDEITVPEARNNKILITGTLQHPGQYPYHEPMTLADAIALAGGEVRGRTRFSHTIIIRQKPGLPGKYTKILANFVRFVRNGDQSQNVILQPGDFIFVPETDTPNLEEINAIFNAAYIINLITGGTFVRP
ncbi:MAG TPA: polysaccharide biosynthesis/export family protein [Fimbriimonas sp.]|nr:polysaccharide biosynthesis/export family protein [Fimbriimonas sp.]